MQTVTIHVKLTLEGHELEAAVAVPAGPARPRDVLPILQNLTDAVVALAEQSSPEQVSCAKGCGACCRQMVPIAPAEAYYLRDLVAAMPAPARRRVLQRFDQAKHKLNRAGVLPTLTRWRSISAAEQQALDVSYFRAGVACPFLEDEACTIHPHRPLACREFLVTSPAECCNSPTADHIRQLPLAAKVSNALRGDTWVPLVLAIDFAGDEREPAPQATGPEVLQRILAQL